MFVEFTCQLLCRIVLPLWGASMQGDGRACRRTCDVCPRVDRQPSCVASGASSLGLDTGLSHDGSTKPGLGALLSQDPAERVAAGTSAHQCGPHGWMKLVVVVGDVG